MANELQFVLYNIDQEDIKIKVAIKDAEWQNFLIVLPIISHYT